MNESARVPVTYNVLESATDAATAWQAQTDDDVTLLHLLGISSDGDKHYVCQTALHRR